VITYKPGWTVEFLPNGPDLYVHVETPPIPCTRGGQQPLRIGQSTLLPAGISPQDLGPFIRQCVLAVETHELDEHLRLDGQLVNDPHQPQQIQE
jgi:hypothetical protein